MHRDRRDEWRGILGGLAEEIRRAEVDPRFEAASRRRFFVRVLDSTPEADRHARREGD